MTIKLPSQARSSLGGDPELFLLDETGHIAPLHNVTIPNAWGERPLGHRDGCAFEFNTHVDKCRDGYVASVGSQMYYIQDFAHKNGWTVAQKARAKILKADLKGAPADMLKGGCDPDIDAYSGFTKTPGAYRGGDRYAGGHMHWGIAPTLNNEFEKIESYAGAVRLLDIWIGLPLTAILGAKHAADERARRRYYGQAGSFRVQPHGLEYRTPSAAAYSNPVLLHSLLGMGRLVMNTYFQNMSESLYLYPPHAKNALSTLQLLDEDSVRRIIDMSDFGQAQDFCMEVLYPSVGYAKVPIDREQFWSKSYRYIVTAMAAMTVGAQHEVYLSDDVGVNWKSGEGNRGPAQSLRWDSRWPFFEYAKGLADKDKTSEVPFEDEDDEEDD